MKMMISKMKNAVTGFAGNLVKYKRDIRKGALLGVVTTAIMFCIFLSAAANTTSTPRTIAEPPAEATVTFDIDKNRVYSADDGIVVVGAAVEESGGAQEIESGPLAQSAEEKNILAAVAYTLPQEAQLANGSLGVLSIPKIGLSVNVYETDDEMEAMTKGLAHFKTTSAFDGNIGACGHNVNLDGSAGYFYNLHKLAAGDTITYKTALGKRAYAVQTVNEIPETDWSYLGRTEDNRITLITCITGKQNMRLMMQAVESK